MQTPSHLCHICTKFNLQADLSYVHSLHTCYRRHIRTKNSFPEYSSQCTCHLFCQMLHHNLVPMLHINIHQTAQWRIYKQFPFLHIRKQCHGSLVSSLSEEVESTLVRTAATFLGKQLEG